MPRLPKGKRSLYVYVSNDARVQLDYLISHSNRRFSSSKRCNLSTFVEGLISDAYVRAVHVDLILCPDVPLALNA